MNMGEIDLQIQGAKIATSYGVFEGNLYVNEGKVVGLGKLDLSCRQLVDAGGLFLLPGMVDAHVHFMDPGDTSREDFPKGSAAAAVAGVTTVIEHNHARPVYTGEDLRKKVDHLKNRSVVDFGLGAHLLPHRLEMTEDAIPEGAAFMKVFTCTTHGVNGVRNGPLFTAMNRFKKYGPVFLVHAEDESLTETAEAELRASGREDGGVIPEWRNRLAEQVAVNNVAQIALASKAKVVIAHCSHSYIVDILLNYQSLGAHIWAESCPQYFFLSVDSKAIMLSLAIAVGRTTPPRFGYRPMTHGSRFGR